MTHPPLLNAKSASALFALVVLGAIAFFALTSSRNDSLPVDAGSRRPAASLAAKSQASGQLVTPSVGERATSTAKTTATSSLYSEIRDSKNLRATMDRLRALPDPSGEISFQLAKAIDDCGDYDGTKPQQARAQAATVKDPVRRELQERMLTYMVTRCIGFESPMERHELIEELHDKAFQARHPAELAQRLYRDFARNRDVARGDAAAIDLLEKAPFPDVIREISAYIGNRNNGPTLAPDEIFKPGEYRKYDITGAAWILLECDLGLDCGSQNRILRNGCAHRLECGSENVDEHVRNNRLSPTDYATALATKQRLLDALQAKDWVRFGLYPLPQKSSK